MKSSQSTLNGLDILIVEDDLLLRKQIAAYLERLGADVTAAGDLRAARQMVQDLCFDFVLLDVNLPDGLGTDLLEQNAFPGTTTVIIITAEGNVAGAVHAMRLGASDYLVKPFDPGELPLVIQRARRSKHSARLDEHRRNSEVTSKAEFFFGPSLRPLECQLEKILAADRRVQSDLPPVLIQGETGTGKTTIARWVHHQGPRAQQPLVEVNCSALPEQLAESELFGHERGAFTDARTTRLGLFEAAQGGTLFLDELPSLSFPLQAKVLTAIEDKTIRRLGGNKLIPVDVRLIGASNQDLKALVAQNQFREDLYHRLDFFRLQVVPLRERGDDILKLAEIFLTRLCKRHRLSQKQLHPDAVARLRRYPWPGNVRELAHELERAIVFEEGEELLLPHLPPVEAGPATTDGPPSPHVWFNEAFQFPDEGFQLEEAINRLIHHALQQTKQNVSAASRLLGVSRDYVRYRLEGNKNGKAMKADF